MDFDYDAFLERLQKTATSKDEATQEVYNEIRKAEGQKVGFLNQAIENPDFYKYLSNQADSYITYLKVLHNKIAPDKNLNEQPDEQTYKQDAAFIDRTLVLVKHLEEIESKRLGKPTDYMPKGKLGNSDEDL